MLNSPRGTKFYEITIKGYIQIGINIIIRFVMQKNKNRFKLWLAGQRKTHQKYDEDRDGNREYDNYEFRVEQEKRLEARLMVMVNGETFEIGTRDVNWESKRSFKWLLIQGSFHNISPYI